MSEFMAFVVAGVLLVLSEGRQARVEGGNLQAATDRPDLTETQIQGLRAKNIFSPFRTKPFPKKPEIIPGRGPEGSRSEVPARPKPLVLTGIVYDASSGAFQAIVEDKNPAPQRPGDPDLRILKEPKFLKAGGEVAGIRIESVEKDKVVVIHRETRKDLGAGDPLPDTAPEGASVAPAPTSTPAPATTVEPTKPVVEPGAVNSVLEELKKKNKKKDRTYDEP